MYTVYKGRDNTFTIQLLENDEPYDISAIDKVGIIYKGTEYDSDVYPESFDYTTGASDGKITFKLGAISALTEGRDSKSELITYDPTNTNGVYWGYLSIRVMTLS
ncbi:MAG: hypothetical protein GWN00_30940 [Aliifodinibius sp.]|nr:hypothetical protein [Fodinibius sp.]NIV15195.1 hypothetical protein [Fodinibius sp.]NIY29044.1 hypothetical protein [Fodinibius sp.]